MKKVLILGSTGSIGLNALQVIKDFPDEFEVAGLSVNGSVEELEKQVKEFSPEAVTICDKSKSGNFTNSGSPAVYYGEEGLARMTAELDYDILLTAVVGFAGLTPTIEGIKRGKRIALANKETLVVAGEYIMSLAEEYGAEIIPVDSEHSAIFQCLTGENNKEISKLILTASGGPFRELSFGDLENVTRRDALNHPNWKMGNKITIDSATMMNKGLEVIEARWLFGVPKEKIDVVVHPQSIIHSMVEFVDGSIKAQLSTPDMKLPIQYALTYPERFKSAYVKTNLPSLATLTFYKPDEEKFRCLGLAYEAMQSGGTAPCILNAANEVAVSGFLEGAVRFTGIARIIENALDKIENHRTPDIGTIYDCDRQTRIYAKSLI